MNCLFWNVNRQKINNIILKITLENDLNILALAEYDDNIIELKKLFIKYNHDFYILQDLGTRITIFTSYPPSKIERIIDKRHYTLFRIKHPSLGMIMFGFIHLFSKLTKDENDYFSKTAQMVRIIENKEQTINSDLTILAGDFNMNPYEKGMLAGGALFSFPTIFEAKKKKRTIDEEEYSMFYNPMWKFFGDNSLPGTYYTTPTHTYGLHWNIFDQVIYRPSLIDFVENIRIITEINNERLINYSLSIPQIKYSDHLPIYFQIKGELSDER